jgi:lipopolysaccharide/colanic/teichoic acid biosynthesis glycosyltransferase
VSEQDAARVGMARRVLDVVVASVALVLTAPVVLAAMVVIRMTSPGPALFRQERVGARGRPFTILKLRTMTTGGQGLDITMGGDARVTRVGSALRRTSLDELPQLVNVLRGEMTLVGPRPETVSLALLYPPECRWVFEHTPGLTGPAQVRMRDSRVLAARPVAAIHGHELDPERWYLENVVPRRVQLDATFLRAPSLAHTVALLMETAAYLLGAP